MPKLRIPDAYREGFEKLTLLSDTQVQELLTALQEERPTLRPDTFISHITSKVMSIQPDDTKDIIDTLVALYTVRSFLELSIEDFVEDIIKTEDIDNAPDGSEQFKMRLRRLLELASLSITSKAFALLNETERSFHDARIVTDVRPIFGDDPTREAVAAIILHTLRIRYHRAYDRQLDDFFVALDTTDIQELRAIIERADSKAKSLEATLKSAGVSYLSLELS